MFRRWTRLTTLVVGVALICSVGLAGEKKLMHCFTFTPVDDATDADWEAFKKATDELPSKIDGLNKVWLGKLRRTQTIYGKTGEAKERKNGVCMEMDDEAALETYADHVAHREWEKVYFKVRQRGTTTIDILGK